MTGAECGSWWSGITSWCVGSARCILSPRAERGGFDAGRGYERNQRSHYRRVSRQPAASASSTEQNQRVPLSIFMLIRAYQRLVGL